MVDFLLAYDGSSPAKKALEEAAWLAKELKGKVYVLYVVDTNALTEVFPDYTGEVAEIALNKAKEVVNEAVEALRKEGVEAEGLVEAGSVAEKIVEVAKSKNVKYIIMGAHGYSGIKKLLIGSVSDKVIRLSDRPVLVVKG
ncbi:universal stress protein [Ignicoccus hospitalis]|uniref:UspA domain protein n=1 Tax=Ignicoccus hospitalis (strain KIN4/I / DSM 18386 / JCM 14125) TaxID=453591 RepID=A8A9N7_IGNH4|nr:universal stress protein [Ignicoccus hospitalis]ABU81639.1 UspA domain protein [Ignicoccus hospitalis KIN4/I]HIH89756.1 universal stress protein [Desulfurococcaceae archaeon]